MGTAPPSKPLSEPAKPFKRNQHKACLQNTFLPKPRKDPSVLLHLLSRREWQKALIRITLFPSEVTQRQKMTWYGVQWSLLPLHLACALQPPSEVVSMLLSFHSDTARVLMNRCAPSPLRKKRQWQRSSTNKKKLVTSEQNNYALYQSNRGQYHVVPKIDTAPSSSDEEQNQAGDGSDMPLNMAMETENSHNYSNSESGSLLEDEAFFMDADRTSSLHVFETHDESTDSEDEHPAGVAMHPEMLPDYKEAPAPDYAVIGHNNETANSPKKSSTNASSRKRNIALQLNANGSLNPMEINSPSVSRNQSKMQWNLDPLLMEADALLPLHIACLYRASPAVITYLLDAYPNAAHETALGMLPIHMACAGFELPSPVLPPPPGPVPFPMNDEYDMPETLRRLQKAFPDSLNMPSQINGMTPKTYIDEILDDGSYKDECLEALGFTRDQMEREEEIAETRVSDYDNTTLTTRVPDEVHCDEDNSTLPSLQTETSSKYLGQDLPQINGFSGSRLYSQMLTRDWESALSTIEEQPKDARKWQYGIELDRIESMNSAGMWKRLPIHSACVLHAPIGVIETLHWAYPKGITIKDPFNGALPLHLACRHSAPPELVKTIIIGYPEGSRITDDIGRLPLHLACLSGASRLTFIYLLKAYPHAVLVKDDRRRSPLQYAKQNPTLRAETVELLELVHHFLEKQHVVEDDYSFEGFQSPRRVSHCSDGGSVVSGFYETRSVASPRPCSNTDDNLDSSPLSGSQASEDKETAERLVKEFSKILEEKDIATDEDESAVTKLAPRFSSTLSDFDHDLPFPTDRSYVELPGERLSKISEEEDSALDDTETEPEDGIFDLDDMQISHEDNSFEVAKSIDKEEFLAADTQSKLGALISRNEDSFIPDGSLMCLHGNGQSCAQVEAEVEDNLEDAQNDNDADKMALGISEANPSDIVEDTEVHALSSKALDLYIEEHGTAETSNTDEFQCRVDDFIKGVEQEPPPGDGKSPATDFTEVHDSSSEAKDEELSVHFPAVEQEPPSGDGKSAATGFKEVHDSSYEREDEEASIPFAAVEQEPPSSDGKSTATGFMEAHDSSSEAKDEEPSIPSPETCSSSLIDRIDTSVSDGVPATVLPSKDADPADEAAGCFSPVNVPSDESPNLDEAPEKADTLGTTKSFDVPPGDAQAATKKDTIVEIEFITYLPLAEDAATVETSNIASSDERISLESLSSRPNRFLSINKDCSTTDATVLAGKTSSQTSQSLIVYTGDSAAALYCPNHDTITDDHESEKKSNENSLEIQSDYKSDLSQTVDSVTDVESATSTTFYEPRKDEPVVMQERDDQNKTSSPKREERLDIL